MDDWGHEADIHDIPDYPDDWTAEQRVAAYWFALAHTNMPAKTSDWHAVEKAAQRESRRLANLHADRSQP